MGIGSHVELDLDQGGPSRRGEAQISSAAESFLFLMEGDMRDYRCWILDCRSRHPDLMERMMQRMRVSRVAAARIDGGMAWYEARTKCIFCRRENECARWLEHPEEKSDSRQFCPNVAFFQQCAPASKDGEFAEPQGQFADWTFSIQN